MWAQHNVIAELAREFQHARRVRNGGQGEGREHRLQHGGHRRAGRRDAGRVPQGPPQGEERLAFRPGYATSSPRLIWVGGLMLGWDLAFPEVARSLALDGASCCAWGELGESQRRGMDDVKPGARQGEFDLHGFGQSHRRGVYLQFCGHSMVVGPRGGVHAVVEDDQTEGYCLVKIDLDEVRKTREESQLFQCRQPQSYRTVVRKY